MARQVHCADPNFDESNPRQPAIEQFQQNIKQLKTEHGVYHPGIGENLLSLGQTYKSLKQYDAAREHFERALQNHRVNYGLHSESQIAIVENLIDVNQNSYNWEALDKNYSYLDWLYRRIYGHNAEKLILRLEALAESKLKLYYNQNSTLDLDQLIRTRDLFEKVVALSEDKAAYLPNKLSALYNLGLVNYMIALFVNNTRYERSRTSTDRQEPLKQEALINRAFINGENALKQMVEEHKQNPKLSESSEILALTYLGDLYLLFNRPFNAKSTYIEAYTRIDALEDSDTTGLEQLFTQPVQLPLFKLRTTRTALTNQKNTLVSAEDYSYSVTLDITNYGLAKNITITDSRLEGQSNIKRSIRRIISNTRFRPRFENGKPANVKNLKINYVFPLAQNENN